ncbi:response regulator transcription factor [Microbacterium sp. F2E]|uniref:response regulator transcription factor n=1 Tax=Microbacterium sp. F2E TaxID=2895284 RepID=UPI001E46FF2E|nr:response regulator transcription factor [Microbacterium sp. F2E]MCC9055277.1 response regulator transcription factor [Microbacterium sp. F2E]
MIRVLLADDEHLLRTAVASLLELDDDIEVVDQTDNGHAVVTHPARHMIDVFILDIEMPDLDGLETARHLLREDPDRSVVIVTRHARPGVLRSALAAGVRGFVPKSTRAEDLAGIIRTIHNGGRYVDASLAFDAMRNDSPLTEREASLLARTEQGQSIASIASELHLAHGTVRNYLSNAIMKLGATDRHEAARRARKNGWI